jgi:glycosyltransferase involved in cell wall biosynthesis
VIRNLQNLRLPNSLNVGFARARGEILTWTSDDNRYLFTALERMVVTLIEHPNVALVYASQEFIDERGAKLTVHYSDIPETLCCFDIVNACFAYRREIFEKLGGYNDDYRFVEDWEYWLRIARHHDLFPIRECLYQYRQHSASLTNRHGETRWLHIERLLTHYLPQLRGKWPRGYVRGFLRLGHERWRHDDRFTAWRFLLRALSSKGFWSALPEWRILIPLCLGKRTYYALQACLPWLRITSL